MTLFKHLLTAGVALLATAGMSASSQAEGTLKIGLILPYSGQFADAARQVDAGIKQYMKDHGDTAGGMKVEIIRKDVGGIAPPVAKRLSEELVIRDKVDILAGFVLTPNAIAGCGVSAEAKKLMVIMNAATSIIVDKSPYCTRSSFTLPMVTTALGQWAAKSGSKKAYTMVSDYAPGHDSEQGFINGFKAGGGEIVGSVRMAVGNPDFSAYVQKAKDMNPESIFVFIPGGSQPAAFGKALAERGIDTSKVKVMGTQELSDDTALASMGDTALGIITGGTYDYNHKSALNQKFVAEYKKDNKGENPNFFVVGGYDGMHMIYEAAKKAGGKLDADSLIAAVKGLSWESPRGPMEIDPETRDAVETIYVNQVVKTGGTLGNKEIGKVEKVKDPVHEAMKKKS